MKKKLKFRNPFAQLAHQRKSGYHEKTTKQKRKKAKQQFKKEFGCYKQINSSMFITTKNISLNF